MPTDLPCVHTVWEGVEVDQTPTTMRYDFNLNRNPSSFRADIIPLNSFGNQLESTYRSVHMYVHTYVHICVRISRKAGKAGVQYRPTCLVSPNLECHTKFILLIREAYLRTYVISDLMSAGPISEICQVETLIL